MRLIRGEDGKLFQAGIADGQPISLKKQATMRGVSTRRKAMTTPAEKKLCFALQALEWYTGGVARFQREKTVHLADMLSRSLDFYYSQGKVGIEADGNSHTGELQRAKDGWTDELMLRHSGILVLRFKNAVIFDSVHSVVGEIAKSLRDRHGWPRVIRGHFNDAIRSAQAQESWYSAVGEFIAARKEGRKYLTPYVEWFAASLAQEDQGHNAS